MDSWMQERSVKLRGMAHALADTMPKFSQELQAIAEQMFHESRLRAVPTMENVFDLANADAQTGQYGDKWKCRNIDHWAQDYYLQVLDRAVAALTERRKVAVEALRSGAMVADGPLRVHTEWRGE